MQIVGGDGEVVIALRVAHAMYCWCHRGSWCGLYSLVLLSIGAWAKEIGGEFWS